MNVFTDDAVLVHLPVPVTTLRPGRRSHCLAIVEAPLLVERLIIPNEIGKHLLLHDIRIENLSQLAAPGGDGIPAAVFSELAIGVGLQMRATKSGSIVDLVFENTTAAPVDLVYALMGRMRRGATFEPPQPPADERKYHAWVKRRQWIYESLHRSEAEDVFFNGREVLSDTFMPKTALWWVDVDGWKNRPVYSFEPVALGDKRGGLQVVNIDTYEGFDDT